MVVMQDTAEQRLLTIGLRIIEEDLQVCLEHFRSAIAIGASEKPRGRGLYILRYVIAIISRRHIAISAIKGAGPFAHIYLRCDTQTRWVYSTLLHISSVLPAAFFSCVCNVFQV